MKIILSLFFIFNIINMTGTCYAQTKTVEPEFKQFQFKDPATGKILPYNLFIPKDYDPKKTYPLVNFMHDAGEVGKETTATLTQGLGAVIWATPAEQAKHACFVLAPAYPEVVVNDQSEATGYLDITVHLIQELLHTYAIDADRLYTTGQSMGCMMSIAMNIKYPDLFAASFLVAGQWDPAKVAPMAKSKLWIIVSEDDEKAFPGMNAITKALKETGAKVCEATWNANETAAVFTADVNALEKGDCNIKYVHFKKGTVIPPGESAGRGGGHRNTWRVAYTIEGVRDWLFKQRKP